MVAAVGGRFADFDLRRIGAGDRVAGVVGVGREVGFDAGEVGDDVG